MQILNQQFILPLVVAVFVGGAAGALGAFMIMKRMALVGDALTHVALPGMGLALLWGYDPFWGALLSLFLAIIGIWQLRERTHLPFEALVGIFFTASLALGILLIPNHEVVEALFGDIASLRLFDAVMSVILAAIIWLGIKKIKPAIVLTTISEDLAMANGVSVSRTNFFYLLLVAVLVALGVKFVGALLMGSLVVIPAASAKNLARSLSGYLALSSVLGVLGAAGGVILHFLTEYPPGPLVVIVAVFIFFISYLLRRY